jgi:hypothetical protein
MCLRLKRNNVTNDGNLVFRHKFDFPYIKQPTNNTMDAYYAILHMRAFVQDQRLLLVPESMQKWGTDLANDTSEELREEFTCIQGKIATILFHNVIRRGGIFHQTKQLSKDKIKIMLKMSRRPFNSLEGYHPFPPQQI